MNNKLIPKDLVMLNVFFATALVIANVLAGKIVMIGSFVIPAAVITYAFTFLFTDIIHERYGKEAAQQAILYGFAAQIFASIMIFVGQYLPVAPFAPEAQTAYDTLLGQNYRFVIASTAAYLVSQNIDVYLFSSLKKATNSKFKWLRNNLSTIASQFIDTAIFITIAFIGDVPNIFVMIFSQFVIKLILALIDTPLFYLFTRETKTKKLETAA